MNNEHIKTILNCSVLHMENTVEYADIQFDSRKISRNGIFVAVPGTQVDGHRFIAQAIQNGATGIVCEKTPEQIQDEITYFQVESSHEALALLASEYYGNPSAQLKLVGVTGTNGKTTIASLMYQLMELSGYKAGLLSTVRNYIHTEEILATHTTPDPLQINALMRKMLDAGCQYCFMEVSSHALDQKRVAGLDFDGAIFTNLSHDHLDYHKDFQSYLTAKKSLFDVLKSDAFALVNTDDKNAAVMIQNCKAEKKSFSLKRMSDFRLKIEEKHFHGMQLFIDGTEIWTPFLGLYNASNLLAVYAAARLLGFEKDDMLINLSKLKSVEGRMESIRSESGITVIVDYAHTPDALRNVLETLNEFKMGGESIISVVGAGGDRDPAKRPEMGKIAALWSNKVVLTSDNPRTENPEKIIDDIEKGIPVDKAANILRVSDRKAAIKVAWTLAKPGDLVLVAGKGHETYQEINHVKHHFDDREIIRELIKK
ncbi:MAG: UDP-N-acetylmuramoyl-L-alanyl-D-glutamate--2,6-diaminopimelate ligase [Bacteroidota bacterium]|nr:UDP-N-acetylmuramoyl-L-alanyl-D-glutamate--2,6-diaminopimelate ligase [Bacteroidota bacterium]